MAVTKIRLGTQTNLDAMAADGTTKQKISNVDVGATAGDLLVFGQSGAELNGLKAITTGFDANNLPINNVPTPTLNAHAVNKAYVDNKVEGLTWRNPCVVLKMVDDTLSATPAPVIGYAYVVGPTPTGDWATAAFVEGDIVECIDDQSLPSDWVKVVSAVASEPPQYTRIVVAPASASPAGSFAGHANEIGDYEYPSVGAGWNFESPLDGWAVLINGENSQFENKAFVYDTTPSAGWIQFAGGVQVYTAGDGINPTSLLSGTIDVYPTASESGLTFAGSPARLQINWSTYNPEDICTPVGAPYTTYDLTDNLYTAIITSTLQVYRNGQLQRGGGNDYSIVSSQIVFGTNGLVTDVVTAVYWLK